MSNSLKLKIARAQLATALDLFVRGKDPISVQCLACGGAEVIEEIAKAQGIEPFSTHVLQGHPLLDYGKLRAIRNKYWNAFKHLNRRDGVPRNDEILLTEFDDPQNDAALFVGWWDYLAITKKLPVEVQVFQVWWYALNEDKLSLQTDLDGIRAAFPNIATCDRAEQKRRLRRSIEKWRKDTFLTDNPATEPSLHCFFAPS